MDRIDVICSRRHQHNNRRNFTIVTVERHHDDWHMPWNRFWTPPITDADPAQPGEIGVPRDAYRFVCGYCRLTKTIAADRWWEGVRRVANLNTPMSIDIALLS